MGLIEHKSDCELTGIERSDLQKLLQECFHGYFINRLYHKQVPQYRVLAKKNERIVGQVAVDHRVISSRKHGVISVMGLIDTCVDEKYRHEGIATKLLQELEHWANDKSVDAFVVFADDHRLYKKLGYDVVDVTCRFLAIEDHESIGVIEKKMGDCFMIKFTRKPLDMQGDHIDMLGYVF